MSKWNHSICLNCWPAWSKAKFGRVNQPYAIKACPPESCCYCGQWHVSGIYVRDNQDSLPLCKGHD